MAATFSPTLAGLGGTISEVQHGAQLGPASAHEFADISGTTHAALTGVTADQHHKRTEAKPSPGAAASESVVWTTAFAATPMVICTAGGGAGDGRICERMASSTTGATVNSTTNAGVGVATSKDVMAQEVT